MVEKVAEKRYGTSTAPIRRKTSALFFSALVCYANPINDVVGEDPFMVFVHFFHTGNEYHTQSLYKIHILFEIFFRPMVFVKQQTNLHFLLC